MNILKNTPQEAIAVIKEHKTEMGGIHRRKNQKIEGCAECKKETKRRAI